MAASYKLIGEDCAISIKLGGPWDGTVNPATAPTMTGDTPITGIAKRIGIKSSVEKTNVKAMGDAPKRNRYHSSEKSIEIEQFVPNTGPLITDANVGDYIVVSHNPLSSLAEPWLYSGVITEFDYDAAVATEQSVKITIDLNPDYLPTS